jgi:hypothetical protein
MRTNRENRGLFLFTLIDELFPGENGHEGQDLMVGDRLFYGLLILATLIAILLGVVRWGWMTE